MARIKFDKPNFILQNASGKIGKLVLRQCNGQTYLCSRPASFNPSQKPECVAARNRFAVTSKFASFLHKIPLLNEVWKASGDESLNVRAKLIKDNVKTSEEHWPSLQNTITPLEHHFKIKDVVLNGHDVDIQMEDDFVADENDNLVVILALVDPVRKLNHEKFMLLDASPAEICNFIINIDTPEFYSYKVIRYYFAVIRRKDEMLLWSNTFSFEANIKR